MIKLIIRKLHKPVYEKRLVVLGQLIGEELSSGDSLLDVGCGGGQLGLYLKDHYGVDASGAEVEPRDGCAIPVTEMSGTSLPFDDDSYDYVSVADVLHHEWNEDLLLLECKRVARKGVIVKDHLLGAPLAIARISFIDWLANIGYDIECLYRYRSADGWHELFKRCGLKVRGEKRSIELYPFGMNWLFGNRLQYFAILTK